jgi:hypothetical protein
VIPVLRHHSIYIAVGKKEEANSSAARSPVTYSPLQPESAPEPYHDQDQPHEESQKDLPITQESEVIV